MKTKQTDTSLKDPGSPHLALSFPLSWEQHEYQRLQASCKKEERDMQFIQLELYKDQSHLSPSTVGAGS